MKPETHHSALMAAARIACAAALVACQPRSGVTTETTPGAAPIAAPGADVSAAVAAVAEGDLSQCEGYLDDALRVRGQESIRADPQAGEEACCAALEDHHASSDAAISGEWLHRDLCCPVLQWQGVACTPWGPPAPPELA